MKTLVVALLMGLLLGSAAQGADSPEDMFWKSVKKSDVLDEYRVYVEQYPKGKYAFEAWRRIGQLEAEEKSALAARREADVLRPGKMFKDCAECPEMVVIPAGRFEMGSNDGTGAERPVHPVSIARPFALGKTEVTQGQWKAVMGNNPSRFGNCGDECPVEQVSWDDVKDFIRKLNIRTGKQFRLPSEAEWEYAARAGTTTKYTWGNEVERGNANCDGCGSQWDNKTTAPVGSFRPNAFGLYDMHGDVWEWVEDCWNGGYSGAPSDGSAWAGGNCSMRVLRGGSWGNFPQHLRSADRVWGTAGVRSPVNGFRLARTLF